MHSSAPGLDTFPASQVLHNAARAEEYVPDPHSSQESAPNEANFPALQSEHVVSPILPCVPAGHEESQLLTPAALKEPAGHGRQRLLPSSYFPATQSLQTDAPFKETLPFGQEVQDDEPADEYVPGSQYEQMPDPVAE